MTQPDPQRTHTSDVVVQAQRAGDRPAQRLPATELLPLAPGDAPAVSFTRERDRVLERLDHAASVRRLRRSLSIGICLWLSVLSLDLYVTEVAGEGDLWTFISCRAIGALVLLAVIVRLRREPAPSPAALSRYDVLAFTSAALCIGATALAYKGIESPYAPGVVVVLLARGATLLGPWRRGLWLSAGPALAWPLMALGASRFDARIAEQLTRPSSLATFASTVFLIVMSCVYCVMGGHFAWRLRREAVETRNIGRYKLERRLGGGGMGDVWAAFDITLRQRVALKTVSGHRPGSPLLARLEREVRALAELTHPNTVRVFDYGVTDDGLWYYAMELLHGMNLAELVAREGPLPVARLLPIARQALRALGEAHDKGIVHRDIKPENVFVAQLGGESDVVKLLDFGIARSSDDTKLTSTGFVAGTPAYMPPEAILGQMVDVRSDIYSFGALLYHCLTARLPFEDEEPQALFAAHVGRAPRPVSTVAQQPVPAELEHVIQRCMAKDPHERFASTRTLLDALEAIAAPLPLAARA
ncbi:MAG TPA: serine/threonine-protein kinase [Polyangiaceae bacterium]|nr:serine/threonine-protein kinase [Polyangiaceae bacterium]